MSGDLSQSQATDWPPYLADQQVKRALFFAGEVAKWNSEAFSDLVLHASEPVHMAGVSFLITHEHHVSATQLTRLGLVASATALMRPAFEAYVRGIWLTCADNQQLQRFQDGEDSSDPERLIRICIKLTNKPRYAELLSTWTQSKSSLHGFVHNSYQSLIRRSGTIDVPNAEIVSLLQFSGGMALHASLELIGLARSHAPEGGETPERIEHLARLQDQLVAHFVRLDLVEGTAV